MLPYPDTEGYQRNHSGGYLLPSRALTPFNLVMLVLLFCLREEPISYSFGYYETGEETGLSGGHAFLAATSGLILGVVADVVSDSQCIVSVDPALEATSTSCIDLFQPYPS